jgi:hypothetical protein
MAMWDASSGEVYYGNLLTKVGPLRCCLRAQQQWLAASRAPLLEPEWMVLETGQWMDRLAL